MGDGENKLLLPLKDKTVLWWTVSRFESSDSVDEIVIVTNEDIFELVKESIMLNGGFTKVKTVVTGGARRQDSSRNGVMASSEDTDIVLVHDGARPFITSNLIEAVIKGAAENDGAILAKPCSDTIKLVEGDMISKTIPREMLKLAQTPQGFKRATLLDAFTAAAEANFTGTDEASLIENVGGNVTVIVSDQINMKITVPDDIKLAEAIIDQEN